MSQNRTWLLNVYYLLLCAAIGAVVLGLEVLAARTMAPSIGTGPVAWACLLAVALGALATGNLTGGFLAGRVRVSTVVAVSLAVSAAFLMVVSSFYRPVVDRLAQSPLLMASLTAAVVTQAVPMLLMGVNTPAILHLSEGGEKKGVWHGSVLACGIAGGIAGALLVGLLFLPLFGLSRTYLLLAGMLLLAGIPLAFHERRWWMLSVMTGLIAVALARWFVSSEPAIIQSGHGQLELKAGQHGPMLLIDGMQQTALPPKIEKWSALDEGYLLEAALMLKPKTRNALVIGLGAGLAPRILADIYGQ